MQSQISPASKWISIPAFREEGDTACPHRSHLFIISIPAFREEGDWNPYPLPSGAIISIPAFREEGDFSSAVRSVSGFDFNPRLP